ncbi:SurA N-terminal domain-containing protein [Reinekea thalattae]|uniref:Periplasmic chaperone PpiD n=1 Tax=Reinekea thalattae TaxID=2593301 RepID=A0A5C8Z8Q5_9GAMM|nr:SurA N-terminal domain-containing protein [Reinekea thalattae]TXR53541.1 hypothetical protein FME95_02940 [Reinekea thalattae]
MLQVFRNSAKGHVGKIIVGLIVVTFVLFGAESIVSIAGNNSPATVNGEKISEIDFQRSLASQQQALVSQYGAEFAAQLANSSLLRNQVLSELINQTLEQQLTSDLKFQVSDEQVLKTLADVPAFQIDGKFDKGVYESLLASNGYTHASFLAEQKELLALTQMQASVQNSAFNVEKIASRYAKLGAQQREVRYKEFSSVNFLSEAQATEQEILDYYNENQDQFVSPEQIKVSFVSLTQEHLASQVEVTDAQIEQAYNSYVAELESRVSRSISHIMFTEGDDLMAQAQAAIERLNNGEQFADLAAELSDDPGSSDIGGELGELFEGVYADELYNAAISLAAPGDYSAPVATDDGVHIIRLDSLESPTIEPLSELREQLVAQIKIDTAAQELYVVQEELADVAFTSSDIAEVAETFGVDVQTSDWIQRDTTQGIFANDDLKSAAFSDAVVFSDELSDVVRLENNDLVVLQKTDYQEEMLRELEEVSEQIASIVQLEKSRELMQQAIDSAVATATVDDSWQPAVSVTRVDAEALPSEVLVTAFELAKPSEGQPSISASAVQGDTAYVVAVTAVNEIEPSAEQLEASQNLSSQLASIDQLQLMFNLAREQAKIKIR